MTVKQCWFSVFRFLIGFFSIIHVMLGVSRHVHQSSGENSRSDGEDATAESVRFGVKAADPVMAMWASGILFAAPILAG